MYGAALRFLALMVTLYKVLGASPANVCRNTPGLTVLTSTPLTQMECKKLVFEGIQEIVAAVEVILVALTAVGPNGASFPITIVHAAS